MHEARVSWNECGTEAKPRVKANSTRKISLDFEPRFNAKPRVRTACGLNLRGRDRRTANRTLPPSISAQVVACCLLPGVTVLEKYHVTTGFRFVRFVYTEKGTDFKKLFVGAVYKRFKIEQEHLHMNDSTSDVNHKTNNNRHTIVTKRIPGSTQANILDHREYIELSLADPIPDTDITHLG